MAYGASFMSLLAIIRGARLAFDPSFGYVSSLLYLSAFGSVVAFGTYLTLLGRIGPDRAAYVTVLFPIVALGLSTYFEGLVWDILRISGVILVIIGNAVALTRIRRFKAPI
jgi:drug/metabolite transporter (DMT)-like permease